MLLSVSNNSIRNPWILLACVILLFFPCVSFATEPKTGTAAASSSSSSSSSLLRRTVSTTASINKMLKNRQVEEHRLFPAAQYEFYGSDNSNNNHKGENKDGSKYNGNNDVKYIGIIHPTSNRFSIKVFGPKTINEIMDPAIERFHTSLVRRLPDFAEDYPIQNFTNTTNTTTTVMELTTIEIYVISSDVNLFHGVDESYEIAIPGGRRRMVRNDDIDHDIDDTDDDDAKQKSRHQSKQSPSLSATIGIQAPTVFGAMHGMESLAQLLEFGWLDDDKDDNDDKTTKSATVDGTVITTHDAVDCNRKSNRHESKSKKKPVYLIYDLPVHILDEPAFPFRGLMIDTARHYLPLNIILQNLNVMSMNKMNILHWHITDRESFPYQTKSFPELAEKGAYHPKRIYTINDIQHVIYQAYIRGIRVIPEVDLPGHTRVIGKSHPELMSHCPQPNEPIDPTNEQIYPFVETIYNDLNELFEDDYVHLGGDEVNFDCWENDPKIVQWMKSHHMNSTVELYEYFETKLIDIVVNTTKKIPIVWQEVFNLNLTIPHTTIVDVWKGYDRQTLEEATNASYPVILSGCWYLDHLAESWEVMYNCYPQNFSTSHPELLLGGHASMWGEHVDASNFMSRVWPRASAAAERLWTREDVIYHDGDGGAKETIKERIHKFRCRMVQQGYAAGPTAPGFCPYEVPYLFDDGEDDDTNNDNEKEEVECTQ